MSQRSPDPGPLPTLTFEPGDWRGLTHAYAQIALDSNAQLRAFRGEVDDLKRDVMIEFGKIAEEIRKKRGPSLPPPDVSKMQKSETGSHVKMTVEEATELYTRAQAAEELERYRWYRGTARDIAVHILKTVIALGVAGGLGWFGRSLYLFLAHR